MVGIVAGVAIAGVAVAAYGAYEQRQANIDAEDAQRESNATQSRMASADAARARLQQAREARIRRATALSVGMNTGLGSGTTGVSGAMGSVTSQAAGNIGAINQKESFAGELSYYNQVGADAATRASNAAAIGQLGMTAAGMAVQRIR